MLPGDLLHVIIFEIDFHGLDLDVIAPEFFQLAGRSFPAVHFLAIFASDYRELVGHWFFLDLDLAA